MSCLRNGHVHDIYFKNLSGAWITVTKPKFFYSFVALFSPGYSYSVEQFNIFDFARNHLIVSSDKYSFLVFHQFENILEAKSLFVVENIVLVKGASNLYFVEPTNS